MKPGLQLRFAGGGRGSRHADVARDPTRRRGHHEDPVAEVDRLLHRVCHEQHRRLYLPPELDEQVLHVEPGGGIEGPEGLVHQDDAGPEYERAGDRHPLPHAAGEFMRILRRVANRIEPHSLDPLAALGLPLPPRHAPALQPEDHVVEHRAIVEACVILKHHAAVGPRPHDLAAKDRHRTACGRMLRLEAGDQTQHRALPAAARPEKRGDLAVIGQVGNGEAHILDRGVFPGRAQAINLRHPAKVHRRRTVCRCHVAHVAHAAALSFGPGNPCSRPRTSRGSHPRPP